MLLGNDDWHAGIGMVALSPRFRCSGTVDVRAFESGGSGLVVQAWEDHGHADLDRESLCMALAWRFKLAA